MRLFQRSRPAPIPKIAPIADDPGRPIWSVMIPTYNCTYLFEQALRSVLDQDPGPDRMQIAVVDDCSTGGRHEEIVRKIAPTRVELHRQPANLGLSGNWNACIARSRGRWVHILHQDDYVLPGFYERLARADEHLEVGAAFCRHTVIDGDGRDLRLTSLERPTAGVLIDWLRTISRHQHIQFASILVRRSVYEHLGGFRSDLIYALDWEMWVRISANYPVWYEPEILACYRVSEGTESTRLKRNGRDISDLHKTIGIVSSYLPPELRAAAGQSLLEWFRFHEMKRATRAFLVRDLRSGLASLHRAFRFRPALLFSRTPFIYYKWALKIWLSERLNIPLGQGRKSTGCSNVPETSHSATSISPEQ